LERVLSQATLQVRTTQPHAAVVQPAGNTVSSSQTDRLTERSLLLRTGFAYLVWRCPYTHLTTNFCPHVSLTVCLQRTAMSTWFDVDLTMRWTNVRSRCSLCVMLVIVHSTSCCWISMHHGAHTPGIKGITSGWTPIWEHG